MGRTPFPLRVLSFLCFLCVGRRLQAAEAAESIWGG